MKLPHQNNSIIYYLNLVKLKKKYLKQNTKSIEMKSVLQDQKVNMFNEQ